MLTRDALLEQIEYLKLGISDEVNLRVWLADPDVEMFKDADSTDSMIDAAFAYGFLRGAAEASHRTVLELLLEYEIVDL